MDRDYQRKREREVIRLAKRKYEYPELFTVGGQLLPETRHDHLVKEFVEMGIWKPKVRR